MESGLRPKDIQARVRAGAKVEDLATEAGMSAAMVERFAGPVLAERAHVAATALTSTLRRGGETSSHRSLRLAISERLGTARVDLDSVEWDAYRLADGRWAVTAAYEIEGESRLAEFLYQPAGRFSVTGNDEARGLAGEKNWPPAGESAPDEEPTVNLADEFALVRALETSPAADDDEEAAAEVADELADDDPEAEQDATPDDGQDEQDASLDTVPPTGEAEPDDGAAEQPAPSAEVFDAAVASGFSEDGSESQLDRLFAMFDAPESGPDTEPVYGGLSDAAAVPDVAPAITIDDASSLDVPVEPSLFDDDPRFATPAPAAAEEPPAPTQRRRKKSRRRQPVTEQDEQAGTEQPGADQVSAEQSGAEQTGGGSAGSTETMATPEVAPAEVAPVEVAPVEVAKAPAAQAAEAETAPEAGPVQDDPTAEPDPVAEPEPGPKPRKKKGRASVPSWDEIMFGSPRRR